jgi:hypothetical protein
MIPWCDPRVLAPFACSGLFFKDYFPKILRDSARSHISIQPTIRMSLLLTVTAVVLHVSHSCRIIPFCLLPRQSKAPPLSFFMKDNTTVCGHPFSVPFVTAKFRSLQHRTAIIILAVISYYFQNIDTTPRPAMQSPP